MPTSKSTSPDPGPDKSPAAIAIDAELAGRLVAALEKIGVAFTPYGGEDDHRRFAGTVNLKRARASRDYDVLRGMLGRTDAPQPLRMHRERSYGGGETYGGGERGGGTYEDEGETYGGDNVVVVDDPVPLSAREAVVESPGDGSSGPLRETVELSGKSRQRLPLTRISSKMPISRVELQDHDGNLVAFGPSVGPTD